MTAVEDIDETEEVEESEILAIHNSSLAKSKQNLVNRKSPYIDMFNHEGPVVVNTMCDLTSGVFEHLDITSPMYVDQRVASKHRIFRRDELKKYKALLVECKQSAKELVVDKWTLGALKEISMDDFWD